MDQPEKIFYQDTHVSVTQSRFVSDAKTYAMRNISSVSLFKKERSRMFECLLLLIGALMLFSDASMVLGGFLIVISILMFVLLKSQYTVRINSNSGEADGYISKDKELIQKIVNAMNEAIVYRG